MKRSKQKTSKKAISQKKQKAIKNEDQLPLAARTKGEQIYRIKIRLPMMDGDLNGALKKIKAIVQAIVA